MNLDQQDARVERAISLIWQECTLLDDKDYEGWADLWDKDGMYIVPIDPTTRDYATQLNMVYDDERMRRMRVERMTQGFSPSAVGAARTARTASRFTALSVDDQLVHIRGAQVLVAYKRHHHDVLAADVEYRIRLGENATEDRLLEKVVRLVNSEDAVSASGFLV